MKSRYCFNPSITQKIGRRLTLAERWRRWRINRDERLNSPDVYTVTGYHQAIYPHK